MTATVSKPEALGNARERVLAAALTRFGTDGLVRVTLDDVRLEAGVSVGAMYHHFADKAALIDALYVELIGSFQAEFLAELREHSSAEEGIKAGVRLYLRWVGRHRAEASVLLGHRCDSIALRERNRPFFSETMAWWRTHVHYGSLRDLPFDVIQALWIGPAQEYTRHWLAGRARRTPPAVAEILADAAWHALKEPS
ncbi:MAG TPA: TetR family transcriptional regulator [Solirubrobacteraceae bacterium]|nr:TetR family transcriptional regulator [Solirubrobacteraceae bacterium]